jgi:hypothetical protein
MEINFKANLINKTCVRKFNPAIKKFVPHEVYFVEINPRLKEDIKALKKLAKSWGDKSLFANSVYKNAKTNPKEKTYLLTEQASGYDKLDFTQVLGITQLSKEETDKYCIEYLETRPDLQKSKKEREYKRIGSRILHNLKKIFYDKKIRVNYIFEELNFYLNHGFDSNGEPFGELVWKAQKRK